MYSYDEEQDVLVNNSTGRICPLEIDNFVCDGIEVDPGWRVYVGTENYERLFLNERIRSSLNIVTKWTFQFAILSVIFAFSGLFLSIILNKEDLKFKRICRSILFCHMQYSICLSLSLERYIKSRLWSCKCVVITNL